MTAMHADRRVSTLRPAGGALRAAASTAMLAAWAIALSLCVAVGAMGAADLAGVNVNVPEPGPIPAPPVAPAGLDR